jgi:LPS sulfotransferase NodH
VTTSDIVRRSIEERGVTKSYSIAFSVRCGSTVLSNTLAKYGLGEPTEYFQYPYDSSGHIDPLKNLASEFVELVTARARGAIFGSKMTHDHRAHLDGRLAESIEGYASVDDVLPDHHWIWLERRDTVAQAVSWYVAEATDRWHLSAGETTSLPVSIEYDFFSILTKVMIIGANHANWQAFFARQGIEPLTLVYEELVADPLASLRAICGHIGVNCEMLTVCLEADGGLVSIADRSPSVYRELKERFTDDFMKIGNSDDRVRLGPSLEKWNDFFFGRGWRPRHSSASFVDCQNAS